LNKRPCEIHPENPITCTGTRSTLSPKPRPAIRLILFVRLSYPQNNAPALLPAITDDELRRSQSFSEYVRFRTASPLYERVRHRGCRQNRGSSRCCDSFRRLTSRPVGRNGHLPESGEHSDELSALLDKSNWTVGKQQTARLAPVKTPQLERGA